MPPSPLTLLPTPPRTNTLESTHTPSWLNTCHQLMSQVTFQSTLMLFQQLNTQLSMSQLILMLYPLLMLVQHTFQPIPMLKTPMLYPTAPLPQLTFLPT